MSRYASLAALGAVLVMTTSARSDSVTFDFNNPGGTLGTSQKYTSSGLSVTAYGFSVTTGHALALYGKNGGSDEVGLGIANAPNSDHEIQTNQFIQLDLSKLPAGISLVSMSIGSVQPGEGYSLWASNTLGSLGTEFMTGNTDYPATFSLSSFPAGDHYLSVRATSNDVLLSTLTVDPPPAVPEPASLALLGIGGMSALGWQWRRRKVAGSL
jgi:hypothetical protein